MTDERFSSLFSYRNLLTIPEELSWQLRKMVEFVEAFLDLLDVLFPKEESDAELKPRTIGSA